jgi:hypothetical protein
MSLDLIFYFLILILIVLNGAVRFQNLTAPFKILTIVILIIFVSEVIARILAFTIKNSNPPYHILCILQYAGLAFIYNRLIVGRPLQNYILISIIPFSLLSISNTLFFQTLFSFPSNIIMLSYLIFILFSLILFMQMLEAPKEIIISKQSVFWFNSAILVYSITMPICFGILNYLVKHKLPDQLLGDFIEYFTFLYYLTLGYAIHLDKYRAASIHHG